MKKEAKELKALRVEQVKEQRKQKTIESQIVLCIEYYHKNHIRRDIDNYWKLVLDCMTNIVYMDDVQIVEMNLKKYIDKENPRVEIYIKEITDGDYKSI